LLLDVAPRLNALGVKLVVVGNGSAYFANQFKQNLPWPGEIYLDTTSSAFQAVNLPRLSLMQGVKRWLTTLSWFKKVGTRYKHNMEGDGFQTGGVFLIGPGEGSRVQFSFKEADNDALTFADGEALVQAAAQPPSSSSL